MEPSIDISFTLPQIRATIKSLGIGCDQLTKKLETAKWKGQGARWYNETAEELTLLMEARQQLSTAMSDFLKEMNHLD